MKNRSLLAQDFAVGQIPPGPAGPVGPAGVPGAPGAPGGTGGQGPAGATGDRGPQGVTGPHGPSGLSGPAGPQGEPGPQRRAWTAGIARSPGPAGHSRRGHRRVHAVRVQERGSGAERPAPFAQPPWNVVLSIDLPAGSYLVTATAGGSGSSDTPSRVPAIDGVQVSDARAQSSMMGTYGPGLLTLAVRVCLHPPAASLHVPPRAAMGWPGAAVGRRAGHLLAVDGPPRRHDPRDGAAFRFDALR